jgi:hypothetical protein
MSTAANQLDLIPSRASFTAGEIGKPVPFGFRLKSIGFALLVPFLFLLAVMALALVAVALFVGSLWIAFFDWEPIGASHPSRIKAFLRSIGAMK